MSDSSFRLDLPERVTTSAIFASPHSGRDYPAEFLGETALGLAELGNSEDSWVDKLVGLAPECGAPLLCARLPRAFVDLNRAPDEIDPQLVEGAPSAGANARVASGLGVIPRVVAGGRAIHSRMLTMEEAGRRIDAAWRPYHAALADLVRQARSEFGQAILVDCHSMPRAAVADAARRRPDGLRPEIVLGDRHGASAAPEVMDGVEAAFAAAGFVVARNAPFAGAYVVGAYGRPDLGQSAVQVEVDRSLYMDEARREPGPEFESVRARIGQAIAEIAELGRGNGLSLAAE